MAGKQDLMEQYAIVSRGAWPSVAEFEDAAARSLKVASGSGPDAARWIRSYVLDEGRGTFGTVCIYQAPGPESIRRHASLAGLPLDEILPVADTFIVRPDAVWSAR